LFCLFFVFSMLCLLNTININIYGITDLSLWTNSKNRKFMSSYTWYSILTYTYNINNACQPYKTSVVVLICPFAAEILHGRALEVFLHQ
jgi:hypothetical protein